MSRKFGGKYSPDGVRPQAENANPAEVENRFRGRKVRRSRLRERLLFLAPLPLFIAAIGSLRSGERYTHALWELAAFAILILAAWLLRDGIAAQAAYDERKVARRPAIPRKIFATVLTGIGVAVAAMGGVAEQAAFSWTEPMVAALTYGGLAAIAHFIAFGPDPLRDKGMEGYDAFDTERVAKAVDKAETYLSETLSAAGRFGDRKLQGRVEQMVSTVRDMLRAVEEDPRDLTGARKFLSVYLRGARDATIKYADLGKSARTADARADYVALLDDMETSFAAKRDVMLQDDRDDLDVEIDVLRARLKQEGLRAKTQ